MCLLKGNAVVGQSGGPTAAINATLAGVIKAALDLNADGIIGTLYGMKNGIEGFMREDLVDLTDVFSCEERLDTLKTTPAAALGSCRKKLKPLTEDGETYEKLFALFDKYDIKYFFYIGGNDSMDTVSKLSQYAKAISSPVRFVGIPKTIDNDLASTDHTPGYGSAAKYVATTVKELLRDVSVYTVKAVTIVEIMGRDAGWLTLATALPAISGGEAPDLIYLPEKTFDKDEFLSSVRAALDKHPAVLVTISEGIRFANGEYVGASERLDAFGHKQLSGAGKILEDIVRNEIGCKVRSMELSLSQRCAAHLLSATDIEESFNVAYQGFLAATKGHSGVMMTIVRAPGAEYSVSYEPRDIATIANSVRTVPDEYINDEGNGITAAGVEYVRPLILGEMELKYANGLPEHIVL